MENNLPPKKERKQSKGLNFDRISKGRKLVKKEKSGLGNSSMRRGKSNPSKRSSSEDSHCKSSFSMSSYQNADFAISIRNSNVYSEAVSQCSDVSVKLPDSDELTSNDRFSETDLTHNQSIDIDANQTFTESFAKHDEIEYIKIQQKNSTQQ